MTLDPRLVRQKFLVAGLAFALALLAMGGALLGGEWDGYAIGLVVAALGLVAVGVLTLVSLTRLRAMPPP